MQSNILSNLQNENLKLLPLQNEHFEKLYAVASDPLIWEQHPQKDRYKKDIFKIFFQEAMHSTQAFLIIDKNLHEVVGSTRYYDYSKEENSIFIGYTFYAKKYWGTSVNRQVKKMMLDNIFDYVETVKFHAGKHNIRSRKALEKLGAILQKGLSGSQAASKSESKVEYIIKKTSWEKNSQK